MPEGIPERSSQDDTDEKISAFVRWFSDATTGSPTTAKVILGQLEKHFTGCRENAALVEKIRSAVQADQTIKPKNLDQALDQFQRREYFRTFNALLPHLADESSVKQSLEVAPPRNSMQLADSLEAFKLAHHCIELVHKYPDEYVSVAGNHLTEETLRKVTQNLDLIFKHFNQFFETLPRDLIALPLEELISLQRVMKAAAEMGIVLPTHVSPKKVQDAIHFKIEQAYEGKGVHSLGALLQEREWLSEVASYTKEGHPVKKAAEGAELAHSTLIAMAQSKSLTDQIVAFSGIVDAIATIIPGFYETEGLGRIPHDKTHVDALYAALEDPTVDHNDLQKILCDFSPHDILGVVTHFARNHEEELKAELDSRSPLLYENLCTIFRGIHRQKEKNKMQAFQLDKSLPALYPVWERLALEGGLDKENLPGPSMPKDLGGHELMEHMRVSGPKRAEGSPYIQALTRGLEKG